MYESLATAGVFPRCSATSFTAATIVFFAAFVPSFAATSRTRSLARASAHAQMSVPPHVRKSFALYCAPITSWMYSLMWRRLTSTTNPSSSTNLKTSRPGTFRHSRTTRATCRSFSSRCCCFPLLPGKSKMIVSPFTFTCFALSVASPKLWFSSAYC